MNKVLSATTVDVAAVQCSWALAQATARAAETAGIVFGLVDMSNDIFLKNSNLKTAENLVLSLTYDISSCLVVVFIAYYGGKGSIPRWITASSFLVGFGSLLFAFPYFSGGFNEENVESEGIVEAAGISGYASGYAIGPPIIKTSGNSSFEKSKLLGQELNLTNSTDNVESLTARPPGLVLIPGGALGQILGGCTHSKTFKNRKVLFAKQLLSSSLLLHLAYINIYQRKMVTSCLQL